MLLFRHSKRIFDRDDWTYCHSLIEDEALNIAVSYKHISKRIKMDKTKAKGILKEALRKAKYLGHIGPIRLWIDQGLYREQSFQENECYKFGLFPYTILPTVYVEDTRTIHSRPWLAVEKLYDVQNGRGDTSWTENEIFQILTSNANPYTRALSCVWTM